MFSKERIIEEMKRIAAELGGDLSERDFEQRSTIPLTTLRFHLGSWQRALKEAGLKFVKNPVETKSASSDDLLLELIRLNEDSGEIPTPALIETKGKYKTHHYTNRWKSIAEAFQQARDRFPEKLKAPSKIDRNRELKEKKKAERLEQLERLEQMEKLVQSEKVEPVEPIDREEQMEQREPGDLDLMEKAPAENMQEEYPAEYPAGGAVLEGEDEMNHNHQGIKTEKIKFIPQTIKPQKAKTKPRVSMEPIDFRGLRYAPASRQGVVYLFGMIGHELGFLIESFVSEFPDCEGKRCVDSENNQWEPVRIQFEYKSSDFKTRTSAKGYDESQCDLIVCWNHNWTESPIEVLELRSVLQYLE
jgi:hypothetical protein